MKAAETMAERSRLHGLLTAVDNNITMKVGEPNRVEQWRPILGFEGCYEVSDRGRVRSLDRVTTRTRGKCAGAKSLRKGKPLSPGLTTRGYYKVGLYRDGRVATRFVHRLVLESFIGPRPDGMQVCHYNGNPTDNRLENLRWDTPSANRQDDIRNGVNAHINRTHCPRGHAYDEKNTHVSARGHRSCRRCAADAKRASRRARLASLKAESND